MTKTQTERFVEYYDAHPKLFVVHLILAVVAITAFCVLCAGYTLLPLIAWGTFLALFVPFAWYCNLPEEYWKFRDEPEELARAKCRKDLEKVFRGSLYFDDEEEAALTTSFHGNDNPLLRNGEFLRRIVPSRVGHDLLVADPDAGRRWSRDEDRLHAVGVDAKVGDISVLKRKFYAHFIPP